MDTDGPSWTPDSANFWHDACRVHEMSCPEYSQTARLPVPHGVALAWLRKLSVFCFLMAMSTRLTSNVASIRAATSSLTVSSAPCGNGETANVS